jgi:trk system potassium uptake protein
MKAIIANLGFVLQTSGIIILFAIPAALIYNEQEPLIGFLMTSVIFLVAGFLMNRLSQKRELDFKSSCILISIVFILLGAVGSIPYFFAHVFADSGLSLGIVNSFFESVSGYTTTGLTMVTDPDSLPRSIILYRGLTQWYVLNGKGIRAGTMADALEYLL